MSPEGAAKPQAVHVRLTVRTTSGHFEDEFNLHERARGRGLLVVSSR